MKKVQLEEILSSIDEVVWATRADTNQLLYINNAVFSTYGYSPEEMMKDKDIFFNAIHPDDREAFYVSMQIMLNAGRSESEFRIRHKNGAVKHLRCVAHFKKGAGGGYDICSGITVDITKLRIAENELVKKENEVENILESIRDGFFALDKNWNITYVNKEFERIYNCKRGDFIGMNYWKRFPKAKHQKFYAEYCRAMKDQVVVGFDEFSTSLNKWVSLKVYPTLDGITVYFTDISEQKKLLEKMLKDEQKLRTQNEALKEIAWIQSHKVRAPLARILGLVPLLNFENPSDNDNKTILEGIKTSSDSLDTVIKEITEKTGTVDLE